MKKKSVTWKLVVGILFVVYGISSFGEDVGLAIFGIVAGAALIFWWKKSRDKIAREQDKNEAVNPTKMHKFKVVGVTYENDDGTSRQDVLEQIYKNGKTSDVVFKHFTFDGSPALYVIANGKCVGCVASDCVGDVTALINSGRYAKIFVDKFKNDDGDTIYYASITLQ